MASKRHSTASAEPALRTPNDIRESDRIVIADALNAISADLSALNADMRNSRWRLRGPHFRDYHLLLDEQADTIIACVDPLAECARKPGMAATRPIGDVARRQRVKDDDRNFAAPKAMLSAHIDDNGACATTQDAHETCEDAKDAGLANLLEVCIDEAERRTWFLFEASRGADGAGP